MAQQADNANYNLKTFFNGGNDGLQMIKKDGDGFENVGVEDALSGADVIAIYFSAHWCPVCDHDMWLYPDAICMHSTARSARIGVHCP